MKEKNFRKCLHTSLVGFLGNQFGASKNVEPTLKTKIYIHIIRARVITK